MILRIIVYSSNFDNFSKSSFSFPFFPPLPPAPTFFPCCSRHIMTMTIFFSPPISQKRPRPTLVWPVQIHRPWRVPARSGALAHGAYPASCPHRGTSVPVGRGRPPGTVEKETSLFDFHCSPILISQAPGSIIIKFTCKHTHTRKTGKRTK